MKAQRGYVTAPRSHSSWRGAWVSAQTAIPESEFFTTVPAMLSGGGKGHLLISPHVEAIAAIQARCTEGVNSDVQLEVEERGPIVYIQEIYI